MKNDDIETLRILFGATTGELCNQERWNDAKEMEGIKDRLIQALESQSEDCISRQAVEEMIKAEMPERGMWEIEGDKEKETVCEVCIDLMQKLSELPPVTPHPKTGHWIRELIRNEKGGCIGAKMICSKCGNDNKHDEYMNYCPNCGAKMVKQQERSDKE